MKDDEVNTIIKAKVDEARAEITKAYDAKLDELKARLDKMENETIQKSGVAVVLREGNPEVAAEVVQTNAGIVASFRKKVAGKV